MTKTQVAIVGGGLAGLNTARLLHRAGVEFLLIEARERAGGRVLTLDEQGRNSDDGFDLGPSWFWPDMQPGLGALVRQLGLASVVQHAEGDVLVERTPRESPRRLAAMSQAPRSMRVVGGMAALTGAICRDLPAGQLRFGESVTAMRLTERGVDLTVRRPGGGEVVLSAGAVIAALPPRLLDETVRFEPEQEAGTRRAWQGTPTWMAPHAKFFAIYDRPFWRDLGLSGTAQSMVGPLAEMHDATTHSGRAALFGFVGIAAAQRAGMGEAAITGACVAQLVRLFGDDTARPIATLYKDWCDDPLTATAADSVPTGHASGHVPRPRGPWERRLFLAGSEAAGIDAGYLSGAVAASERAVADLVGSLPVGAD